MTQKAYLLTDASFDPSLRIGVAAFSLVVNEVTTRRTIRLSNLINSHEAELIALNEGLRELAEQTNNLKKQSSKVEQLHMFTDSQTVIDMIGKKMTHMTKNSDIYLPLHNNFHQFIKRVSERNKLHKVKSHVPHEEASHIERAHNLIDELASEEMNKFRDEILSPNIDGTKVAAIILSNNLRKEDRNTHFKLGYDLASKGYHIRYLMEDVKNPQWSPGSEVEMFLEPKHPVLDGVLHYCKKNGLKMENITTQIQKYGDKAYVFENEIVRKGCFGMDACIYHRIKGGKQIKLDELNKPEAFIYGALSRLMYGIQIQGKKFKYSKKTVVERHGDASEFVINLNESKKYSNAVEQTREVVDMPFLSSVESLYEKLPNLGDKERKGNVYEHELS